MKISGLKEIHYFHAFFFLLLTLPGEQSTQRGLVPIRPKRDSQTTVTKKRKGMCRSFQQTLVGEERVTSPQESLRGRLTTNGIIG